MGSSQSQPKYRIVEEYLRSRILSGEFVVDSLLPTEKALSTSLGVSRATVRAALANIQSDGLISRSAAIGSRVIAKERNRAFHAGWNSVEALLQHTKDVRLNVTSVVEMELGSDLAKEIGFARGRSMVRVEGLRWNQDETDVPICLVEIYFDALYNGIASQIGMDGRPVADLIEERYSIRIERIRQEISAGVLTPETASAVSADSGGPALCITRWYSDSANRVFQMTRSQYPADRFRYVLEFGRAHV